MASVSSVLDEAGVDFALLSHTRTERAADEANALGEAEVVDICKEE
jgi:hypothetical protein